MSDRDPGDESDYPETEAEQIAWLQRQLAKALRPYVGARNTPELRVKIADTFNAAMRKPWSATLIVRATVDPGPDHDHGDEDTGQIVTLERGILISAIISALER